MYTNIEAFAVNYIKEDIGKYRGVLISRIEYLEGMKSRFEKFISNEIEISK